MRYFSLSATRVNTERLLTHNMLQCHVKNCRPNESFPLTIKDPELERTEAEFNPDFMRGLVPKLDWTALRKTAGALGLGDLPAEMPEATDEFLQMLHALVLETRVVSGSMVCDVCHHVFPITNGIPNMLLQADEV
ncbi:hypothetical protein CXG81DRAFT_12081 [Caulochytrium protostelioides]|uniref:Trm112p-domain-containing protein n=1 Tax=Caulochytrium protostelioides TaxID=1555241 RepID=A0A4P9WXX9_9FUNG|nr:Trm112p-domain-containing protein [Caulochytrium protostelioides]RKP01390.1 hypothetical protein CXG81DRAFT_12081 [Caulochytrium protostelioides]|eukprot:RKP01390.1 hypothetical protein CXG81DRAFT_12081 [Caulochytrium protostelioides]